MLTKKQLLDMSNNSVSWNLKDAAQTALAYLEMLERLQWGRGDFSCPVCRNYVEKGHKSDCMLGTLLRGVK